MNLFRWITGIFPDKRSERYWIVSRCRDVVVQFRRYVILALLDIRSVETLLVRSFLAAIMLCNLLGRVTSVC